MATRKRRKSHSRAVHVDLPSIMSRSSVAFKQQTMEKGGEEITEEQRKRAEANRAAALAKRKAMLSLTEQATHQNDHNWGLVKCRKLSPDAANNVPVSKQHITSDSTGPCQKPEKFGARLEICSPDSFSVTPVAIKGFVFPGEDICFEKLRDCLANVSEVLLEIKYFQIFFSCYLLCFWMFGNGDRMNWCLWSSLFQI